MFSFKPPLCSHLTPTTYHIPPSTQYRSPPPPSTLPQHTNIPTQNHSHTTTRLTHNTYHQLQIHTQKRGGGAEKCILKFHCHWQSPHTNYTKWISQSHLLNLDTILYEHNLSLITKLTQYTKHKIKNKINHLTNPQSRARCQVYPSLNIPHLTL